MRVALWMALSGCTGPDLEDTSEPEVTDTDLPAGGNSCEEVWLKVNGPEAPVVGDTWTVLLYCDDALMTGASVLNIDPPSAATIEEDTTTLTWVEAGTATVRLQVGSRSDEVTVEVGEGG